MNFPYVLKTPLRLFPWSKITTTGTVINGISRMKVHSKFYPPFTFDPFVDFILANLFLSWLKLSCLSQVYTMFFYRLALSFTGFTQNRQSSLKLKCISDLSDLDEIRITGGVDFLFKPLYLWDWNKFVSIPHERSVQSL